MRSEQKIMLDKFLKESYDGSFYVGHASVLVRLSGKLFLVDAVHERPLFLNSWLFFPELAIDERLLNVDGIFISHCHEDHYDLTFLRELKKGTPIYITQGRIGFDELLSDTSLNTVQIPPFELTEIQPGIHVYCMPSDHNSFDSSFVIKNQNLAVFQGNDNFLDRACVEKTRRATGKVHHAYIPFTYVWWYPFCLTSITDDQRREEARRLSAYNMKIGAMMAEVFESDLIVPSAGNLVFYESGASHINREVANPFDFVDFVKNEHPTLLSRTKALLAGDYCLRINGQDNVISQNIDREKFFQLMDDFLKRESFKTPPVPPRNHLFEKDIAKLKSKFESKSLPAFPIRLYFNRRDLPEKAVCIDMSCNKVSLADHPEHHPGSITFSIQQDAFERWLNDEISFETILNSQRFLVHRNPEVFQREVWDVIRNHY